MQRVAIELAARARRDTIVDWYSVLALMRNRVFLNPPTGSTRTGSQEREGQGIWAEGRQGASTGGTMAPWSNLQLRRGGEADCLIVAAIDVRARRWGFRHFVPPAALDALPLDERAPRWREALLSGGQRRTWLAERGSTPLGFGQCGALPEMLTCRPRPPRSTRYTSSNRLPGPGVAASLTAEALRDMVQAGHQGAVLWVWADNMRARRFYARQGRVPDRTTQVARQCGVELLAVRYAIQLR